MPPRTPLLDPYAYFHDRYDSFLPGAVVFVAHVVVDLVLVFAVVWLLFQQISNPPTGLWSQLVSLLIGTALLSLLIYLIAWLVVGALMHYLSGGSQTDGTLSDALGVAGWAYAPELLFALPTFAFAWNHIRSLTLDGSDPERLVAELEAIEQLGLHPLEIVFLFVIVGWSVYILAKGTSATHNVPIEKTVPPAAIVGLGSFVLTLLAL